MRTPQRAVLLVGSPKPGASASSSLGTYLLEELEKRGLQTETVSLIKALRSEEATEVLHTGGRVRVGPRRPARAGVRRAEGGPRARRQWRGGAEAPEEGRPRPCSSITG